MSPSPLTIEFFDPARNPTVLPVYTIVAVYAEDPAEPHPADGGAQLDRMTVLDNGDFLIEFTSSAGTTYAVEYSHDMTTWHRVVPAVTANANRTQWIDSGPPKTASHPATAPMRYYRIVELAEAGG